MLKEQILHILDSFDYNYEELKETNKELNSKYLKLQDDFIKHQEKYTRFLSALNLKLLPNKILFRLNRMFIGM